PRTGNAPHLRSNRKKCSEGPVRRERSSIYFSIEGSRSWRISGCGGIAAPPFETYDQLLCNEIRWLVNLRGGEGLAPAQNAENWPVLSFPHSGKTNSTSKRSCHSPLSWWGVTTLQIADIVDWAL